MAAMIPPIGSAPSISAFKGRHAFLSNFHRDPESGISVEALFQSAKTEDEDLAAKIRIMPPSVAKVEGRRAELRDDWEQVKVQVMLDCLHEKFGGSTHGLFHGLDYRKLLRKTDPCMLIEGNNWHDNFWGACTCSKCRQRVSTPANTLGVALMAIREMIV